ncbi:MAG: hypothetical protein ACO2ZM_03390 [Francisellaceae bacterium]
MRDLKEYVNQDSDTLSLNVPSLENAQVKNSASMMEPKLLLNANFKLSIDGKDIKLTPFAAVYPGGVTEAATDVTGALQHLSVGMSTLGVNQSNSLVIAVTMPTYVELVSAYEAAKNHKTPEIIITIAPDSLSAGQYFFKPFDNSKGKWGNMIDIKTTAAFISTDELNYSTYGGGATGSNAVGILQFNNIRALANFDVSLATNMSNDSAKMVVKVLANNSVPAG